MPAIFERLAAALHGLVRGLVPDRRPLWRVYPGLRRTLRGRRACLLTEQGRGAAPPLGRPA